jgi:hypothetical protein
MFLDDVEAGRPNVAALDGDPPTPEDILKLAVPPLQRRVEQAWDAICLLLELLAGWHSLVEKCRRASANKQKMDRRYAAAVHTDLQEYRYSYVRLISQLYDAGLDVLELKRPREEVCSWMPALASGQSLKEQGFWDPETSEESRLAWEGKLSPFIPVLWSLKAKLRANPLSILEVRLEGDPVAAKEAGKPVWNYKRSELSLNGEVIKRVTRPSVAANVIKVLDSFEAAGWPDRIDDPIVPGDWQKLNDTVKSLNKHLIRIRFHADGSGRGITWRPI